MADISSLLSRIDGEFAATQDKIDRKRAEVVQDYEGRQKRLETFTKVIDGLRDVWRPRLEALAQRFGERVKVTPRVTPSSREATFEFQSPVAHIRLKFSAYADRDVRKVILTCDLDIVPVLTRFDAHSEVEFPLDAVDPEAVARWTDDRVVGFVRTYLGLHENEQYMKEHMVADPIAGIRFPKYAAAASVEWQGQKYYFISEDTRREFEKKNAVSPK
jgi:YHS domain-containing protein